MDLVQHILIKLDFMHRYVLLVIGEYSIFITILGILTASWHFYSRRFYSRHIYCGKFIDRQNPPKITKISKINYWQVCLPLCILGTYTYKGRQFYQQKSLPLYMYLICTRGGKGRQGEVRGGNSTYPLGGNYSVCMYHIFIQ